jgi:hypothetical protein
MWTLIISNVASQKAELSSNSHHRIGALFVRATVRSARKVAVRNGHYVDDMFRASDRVNAGLAVALRGGGLAAPVLIDADQMSLDQRRHPYGVSGGIDQCRTRHCPRRCGGLRSHSGGSGPRLHGRSESGHGASLSSGCRHFGTRRSADRHAATGSRIDRVEAWLTTTCACRRGPARHRSVMRVPYPPDV